MTTPCLYSIIRYAPYAETEEFANVGVVLCAPKKNFFVITLHKATTPESRISSKMTSYSRARKMPLLGN